MTDTLAQQIRVNAYPYAMADNADFKRVWWLANGAAAELVEKWERDQPDFSNTFANINDTCRSRGFEAGPSGRSTEDRVIALAQAYDALQAEVKLWQGKALDAGNPLCRKRPPTNQMNDITQLPEIDTDLAQITDHPPAFETPWEPTPEQWEKEGFYAPFVAWESWMDSRMHNSRNENVAAMWDEMDTLVRIEFWSAMIDSCQFAAGKARPDTADLSEAGREGEETNG